MQNLVRGQKIKLSDISLTGQPFYLKVLKQENRTSTLDIACFGLDGNYKLFNDDYMTFFNAPSTPCNAVKLEENTSQTTLFSVDLAKLPNQIKHLVLTAAIDGSGVMSEVKNLEIQVLNQQKQVIAQFKIDGNVFSQEKATMLVEVYNKEGIWRLAAVAQGFNEGLAALVRHFGGNVDDEQAAPPQQPEVSKLDLKKKLSLDKAAKTGDQSIIDLTKKSIIQLEKRNLLNVTARVALVLDASGSMSGQYSRGDVQKVVNRLMPLAINFDDDGDIECWAFAEKTHQLDNITLSNVKEFIRTANNGSDRWKVGSRWNEEIPAIQAVIKHFSKFNDGIPTYVLFISDGGVGSVREMKKILSDAARLPIFWQFVGIGGSNYGALEKLDEMTGRIIDNCNFFALENILSISDEQLYEKLLGEFPDWLKEAKLKNIVR